MLSKIKNKILQNNIGSKNQEYRDKWLEKALSSIECNSRILDAGAGELQYKKFCLHLRYVSQDFAQYNGLGDNTGLQMQSWDNSKLDIISDITNIPEPDASFDAIMCIEVFEHLPNPVLAIKEFSRLLKSNGTLIITAPFCSLTHFAPYHFASGFNKYFYEKHLTEHGFEILEITPNGNYFEYLAQEVRRVPEIGRKYSNIQLSFWERICVTSFLKLLQKFNSKEKGSNELLCFGYHVKALKK